MKVKFDTNKTVLPAKQLITCNSDGTFTLAPGDYAISGQNGKITHIQILKPKTVPKDYFLAMVEEIKEV